MLGIAAVDEAVEELFNARGSIVSAIEILAENEDKSKEWRQEIVRWRKDVFGNFSKDDELGQKILKAVETIENELIEIARLEVGK